MATWSVKDNLNLFFSEIKLILRVKLKSQNIYFFCSAVRAVWISLICPILLYELINKEMSISLNCGRQLPTLVLSGN